MASPALLAWRGSPPLPMSWGRSCLLQGHNPDWEQWHFRQGRRRRTSWCRGECGPTTTAPCCNWPGRAWALPSVPLDAGGGQPGPRGELVAVLTRVADRPAPDPCAARPAAPVPARSGCSSRCWPSGLPSGPIICWGEPSIPLFFCHLGLLRLRPSSRKESQGMKRHQGWAGLRCCAAAVCRPRSGSRCPGISRSWR